MTVGDGMAERVKCDRAGEPRGELILTHRGRHDRCDG
jgi:hypothetical protein